MNVKAWNVTDVMLKCERCGKEIVIPAGEELDINVFPCTSGGWRYFCCHNCDGVMQIYTKTKTGKWRFKSRSVFTEAIVSWGFPVQKDTYKTIKEFHDATLRLYINDPQIIRQLEVKGNRVLFKIPLKLHGNVVIAEKENSKTKHIFFSHKNPDFIPVFFDLKPSKRRFQSEGGEAF